MPTVPGGPIQDETIRTRSAWYLMMAVESFVTDPSPLNSSRQRLVLAICCLSLLIVGMDVTIVNVALPSIRSDLGASVPELQWVVDSYTVVLAALLILSGSAADRFGRRRIFQIGLALFTLGSLLCSLAPNTELLIAFRMVQAVGGSMLNPVALAIVSNAFPDARGRANAFGIFAGVIGISFAAGPVIGGALVDTIGWRSVFWVNVPIGISAIVLAALFVPESRSARPKRVDLVGQALLILTLVPLVYAIIDAPDAESPVRTWLLLGFAGIAFLSFLLVESHCPAAFIELTFFRSVPFSSAAGVAFVAFGGFGAFLFLNTLYLQEVRNLGPMDAGLLMLPLAGMVAVCAPISGRIVGVRGPRIPLLVAGIGMLLGVLPLTALTDETPYAILIVSNMAFGIGFGFVNSAITNSAVSGMPRSQSGVAAAIASTSRQIGVALGVAVAGALVNGSEHRFAQSSHAVWWIVVACEATIIVLALVSTSRWAVATSANVAVLLEEPAASAPSGRVGP